MSLLTFRQRGDWFVVGFNVDRLTDPATLRRATQEMADELERLPLRAQAVITFEGVEQASSQLAGFLLAAKAIVVDDRLGRLVLCRVGGPLSELLRLTRLDRHFEVQGRLRDVLADAADEPRRETVPATRSRGHHEPEWID